MAKPRNQSVSGIVLGRSSGALIGALAFAALGSFAIAACGGNSNANSGGGAAAPGAGGEGADVSVGGSGATTSGGTSSKGGTTGTSGGSTGTTGGSTSASGGTIGASGDTGSGATGALAGSSFAGSTSLTTTACNNGIDDDGDGLIDGLDPECTGPYDNDEGSFATGIPGDNQDPKWQDCFFDGNSGAGDDGCRYATSCLYGDTAQSDPSCQVSQQCIDFCGKSTPNGCDCFGCCTVQESDGTSVDIYTTSTCSLDKLDDTKACPRCTKSDLCNNTCGECELCPGKTAADLPASCTPPTTGTGGTGGTDGTGGAGGTGGTGGTDATGGTGGTSTAGTGGSPPNYTCEGGLQVCGPGLPACDPGLYCQLGCCMVVVR